MNILVVCCSLVLRMHEKRMNLFGKVEAKRMGVAAILSTERKFSAKSYVCNKI